MSTVGQVAGVAMRFTLREIPLTFLVTVFWDFDRESVGISVVPGAAAGKAGDRGTRADRHRPADPQPRRTWRQARSSSTASCATKLNSRLTGSGSAIGDPRIRAGAIIRLEGLGPDFSGDYRVTSATHSLDGGGYKTSFEVYKEILP